MLHYKLDLHLWQSSLHPTKARFAMPTWGVWQYQIGGYPVADKWLKDRKGRVLSLEDVTHYQETITALQRTIEIQGEIDDIYPQLEKDALDST